MLRNLGGVAGLQEKARPIPNANYYIYRQTRQFAEPLGNQTEWMAVAGVAMSNNPLSMQCNAVTPPGYVVRLLLTCPNMLPLEKI